jgi:predicted PurR-regulated permease PerM
MQRKFGMNEENTSRKLNKSQILTLLIASTGLFLILLIANLDEVKRWVDALNRVIAPVVIGLIIAYLANPFFRFFEKKAFWAVRPTGLRRVLSLLCAYLTLLVIICGLLLLIIPQLVDSIQNFAANFDNYLESVVSQANSLIMDINAGLPTKADGSPAIAYLRPDGIRQSVGNLMNSLLLAIKNNFTPDDLGMITNLLDRTTSILTNLIFGVFISIYLLASKELRYAQIMKFRRAYFSETFNRRLTRFCTIADRSFGGFLRGKILDSGIVACMVYVACLIFDIPYEILVAVIVGITDMIPVIGPFIGVIPTAIIILLTDPIKVVIFLISILVIQQIDGNIIAPKILGEHTGVSSLCVMIAILVMGDLMGFVGMLIGVPLFATIIEIVKLYLDKRLIEKGLPVETESYASETLAEPPIVPDETPSALRMMCEQLAAKTQSDNLTSFEELQLRSYALAKKHDLFSDTSDESISRFANEIAELFAQAQEEVNDSDPSDGTEHDNESSEINAQSDEINGKEDELHESL